MRRWILILGVVVAVVAPAASARALLFGFNDNGVAQGVVAPDADARLLSAAGADVHRMSFLWRYAERTPGQFEFGLYDRVYAADIERGVRPLWILMTSPDWSWSKRVHCGPNESCPYPPAKSKLRYWRRLVTRVVNRYPLLAGIEVWNEPNLEAFWKHPNARVYTRLVKHAKRAVRKAGSDIPVLAGSLANAPDTFGIPGQRPAAFLRGMYRAGAAGHFDGLSIHPYSIGADLAPTFRLLTQVDALQARFHDKAPIWVSEIGASTTGQVEPKLQSDLLVRLLRVLSARPHVAAMLVHTLVEPPFGKSGETGYGLVYRGGQPKPAYCALAAERLRSPPNCRLVVFQPPPNAALQARWDAQVGVQAQVDAAAEWLRGHRGSLSAFETGAAVSAAESPGPDADPDAVGVFRVGEGASQSTLLCAASRSDTSYCAMYARGRWAYGHATGTVGAAAEATAGGLSRGW